MRGFWLKGAAAGGACLHSSTPAGDGKLAEALDEGGPHEGEAHAVEELQREEPPDVVR